MGYDYAGLQVRVQNMIAKYGRVGVLRRAGLADRAIKVALINYTTNEQGRSGGLIQSSDRHGFVSALPGDTKTPNILTNPPSYEDEDRVVVGATATEFIAPFEEFTMAKPAEKLDPAGTVVYWDLQLRGRPS
jgi:hypothetical protein